MTEGNPDINKHSVPFGPNNDPKKAQEKSEPWSIRKAVRRICAQDMFSFPPGEKLTIENLAKQVFEGRTPSIGEMVALRRIFAAMDGHPKFSQYVTEDVDGKLVEKKVETQTTLADLVKAADQLQQQQLDESE